MEHQFTVQPGAWHKSRPIAAELANIGEVLAGILIRHQSPSNTQLVSGVNGIRIGLSLLLSRRTVNICIVSWTRRLLPWICHHSFVQW